MRRNLVRERWARGEVAFGSLLGIPAASTAYMLGRAGFDWVSIEQQHAYASQSELLPLVHALELGSATVFIRVGENDAVGISRALDLGATGVVAPMVNTPEQAEMVAANTRFPPAGERSWGAPRHHATPGEANEDIIAMVMIETPLAIKNIDDILAVSGIDGAVLGPADMAISMGLAPHEGQTHPQVWEAFEAIGEACQRHGKHYGSFVTDVDVARRMVERGADFVLFSSDLGHVANGLASTALAIAEMRGD